MAARTIVDAGWAPEIIPAGPGTSADIFARLAKDQDPRDGSWFVTAKFDTIRFGPDGQEPVITPADLLGPDWPTRLGDTGTAAPTFGENPLWRGAEAIQVEGHGWFGSRENYGGPLSGTGQPGGMTGDAATGRLESRAFVVTGDYFRLLLAGGHFPSTCYVGLIDAATAQVLSRINPRGEAILTPHLWDVREFRNRTVRLALVDEESAPGGWMAVDAIEEFADTSPVDDPEPGPGVWPPTMPVRDLAAHPNPFNSGTEIHFELDGPGTVSLEIFDVQGRRLWRSEGIGAAGGEIRVAWDARDMVGRTLPSGAYFCRIIYGGKAVAGIRLILLK
jgi:hypothetical protein